MLLRNLLCTSLRHKAIKQYFMKKSEKQKKRPKSILEHLLTISLLWNSFQANNIALLENEHITTDNTPIANMFDDYFINIANHVPNPSWWGIWDIPV